MGKESALVRLRHTLLCISHAGLEPPMAALVEQFHDLLRSDAQYRDISTALPLVTLAYAPLMR
jgi:hypothetical protein